MTDKKLMASDEFIREKYPFYDPMVAHKDVELSGEQVSSLMQSYAKYLFDNVVPEKEPDYLELDCQASWNDCIDQIKENFNVLVG